MQRFNVQSVKNKIYFCQQDITHITKVLRKKIGDQIECIDQDMCLIIGEITSIKPFVIKVLDWKYNESNSYNVHAFVSIIKKHNFELMVEKLNELNITSITPVYFSRTQHNISLDFNRLKRIIDESSKQCKKIKKLEINTPIDFITLKEYILDNKKTYEFIFANEKEQSKKLSDYKNIDYKKNIGIIIGPEGGFTEKEIITLNDICSSITLTNTILKAETASLYLSSIIIEEIKKYDKK